REDGVPPRQRTAGLRRWEERGEGERCGRHRGARFFSASARRLPARGHETTRVHHASRRHGTRGSFRDHATPKATLIWEKVMSRLIGFGTFAALPEERISDKISRRILSGDQGMIVWWSIGAGVHVEPHSHASEQIVWMLKGKMEFRLGSEQRVC